MVLNDDTNWQEIREVVTESYRVLAPSKLAALLDQASHCHSASTAAIRAPYGG